MTNVLTWAPAGAAAAIGSRRLAALQSSHHAMWNYVTYRDAIALVGQDPDDLYPEGTTRLPGDWADLGWLTCFHGPPASALEAMRAALVPNALDVYPPDLIEPLREEAARALGRRATRVRGGRRRGRPGRHTLTLQAAVDPGDEVSSAIPATSTSRRRSSPPAGCRSAVAIGPETGYRLDPDTVAAAITPRTRAICLVDPSNPYGTWPAPTRSRALTGWPSATGWCSSTT